MFEEDNEKQEVVDLNQGEKIGFNTPVTNDDQPGVPAYKKKIQFSNQRKTTLQKATFGFFIPSTIVSLIATNYFFVPVQITNVDFAPYFPEIAFTALALNIVEIVLAAVTLKKGQKGVVTYLIVTSVLFVILTILLIIYYVNGMKLAR